MTDYCCEICGVEFEEGDKVWSGTLSQLIDLDDEEDGVGFPCQCDDCH